MTSVLGGRDAVITGLSVGGEEGRKGGREEGRKGKVIEEIQVYEKNSKPCGSRYELSPSHLSQ